MRALETWHLFILAMVVLVLMIIVGGVLIVLALARNDRREMPSVRYSSGSEPPYPPGS